MYAILKFKKNFSCDFPSEHVEPKYLPLYGMSHADNDDINLVEEPTNYLRSYYTEDSKNFS